MATIDAISSKPVSYNEFVHQQGMRLLLSEATVTEQYTAELNTYRQTLAVTGQLALEAANLVSIEPWLSGKPPRTTQ